MHAKCKWHKPAIAASGWTPQQRPTCTACGLFLLLQPPIAVPLNMQTPTCLGGTASSLSSAQRTASAPQTSLLRWQT